MEDTEVTGQGHVLDHGQNDTDNANTFRSLGEKPPPYELAITGSIEPGELPPSYEEAIRNNPNIHSNTT